MKIRPINMSVWGSTSLAVCVALFLFTACATADISPPPATKAQPSDTQAKTPPPLVAGSHSEVVEEGVPGEITVNTVEVTVRVVAIDPVNRKAALVGPDGKQVSIKAGPDAENFDQVQVGDMLDITVTEELVVFLDKDGVVTPDGSAPIVSQAPKCSQPGGVMAQTIQTVAKVIAIDTTRRKVTLLFDDGSSNILPVRDDIDLSQHKAGEKVVFSVTERVAISVKKN